MYGNVSSTLRQTPSHMRYILCSGSIFSPDDTREAIWRYELSEPREVYINLNVTSLKHPWRSSPTFLNVKLRMFNLGLHLTITHGQIRANFSRYIGLWYNSQRFTWRDHFVAVLPVFQVFSMYFRRPWLNRKGPLDPLQYNVSKACVLKGEAMLLDHVSRGNRVTVLKLRSEKSFENLERNEHEKKSPPYVVKSPV